jgi:hypothetical protein
MKKAVMSDSEPALAGVPAQFHGERSRLEPGVKLADPSVQAQRLTVDRVLKPFEQTFQVSHAPFQVGNARGIRISRLTRRRLVTGRGGTAHLPNPRD